MLSQKFRHVLDFRKPLSRSLIVKMWVEVGGLYDHLPILLWIQSQELKMANPFKFNPEWIQEDDYRKLVGDTWTSLEATPNVPFMKELSKNLQIIKKVTKP